MCSNLAPCDCDKLHVVDKPNGTFVVLIQWHRGHKKCYFSIIPTNLWIAFKKLNSFAYNPHIQSAHSYIKAKNPILNFMWLRKAHYNVMCRVLKPFEANF